MINPLHGFCALKVSRQLQEPGRVVSQQAEGFITVVAQPSARVTTRMAVIMDNSAIAPSAGFARVWLRSSNSSFTSARVPKVCSDTLLFIIFWICLKTFSPGFMLSDFLRSRRQRFWSGSGPRVLLLSETIGVSYAVCALIFAQLLTAHFWVFKWHQLRSLVMSWVEVRGGGGVTSTAAVSL
jgi:hypothetical protein